MLKFLQQIMGRNKNRDNQESNVSNLTTPMNINCKSRRTKVEFLIVSEIMTTASISFTTQHYLDLGDTLDMSVAYAPELPALPLRGKVKSCNPRTSAGKIKFEGVIEFQPNNGILDMFRKVTEIKKKQAMLCV